MDLVDRLRLGEEEALVQVMDNYGDLLLRTAILLVKDSFLAEEIVQDSFVIAFQKIDQLKEKEKLKSWLIIIVANGCRGKMRTWSWKNIFLFKEDNEEEHLVDEANPEDVVMIGFKNQSIHKAIHQLPYKYREVITLFYFHELSITETANVIKEKENTVKTRLARGRTLLKEILQKGGENFD
ncbi:sigma-70 family RNA polymerase sigma factor [Evansella sp. AB-rgal1]|uniref:sigma-70 family RNA polymerase sigma factor n=1 Tax=Evansella sp. AB-rgal1 TaxID=3242696 RepID=UPI00359DB865